jgi:hypothetical protein
MKHDGFVLSTLAIAMVVGALPNPAEAQARFRATVTRVKPDMLNEWIDLQKNEVVPALKKAGVKTRTVLSSGIFGTSGEYVIIQPFDSTAEFDGPSPLVRALDAPGAARLQEKLRKCLLSSNSYMNTRFEDASNVLDRPPSVIVSVRYRIAQGKMQQFRDLVKSEILPVYKKASVQLTVNQRGPGANVNEVTMATGYNKYADMNGGGFLAQKLGQAEANRINAKFAGIRTLVEVVVRQRVADLSF